jgi:hypothetical protein
LTPISVAEKLNNADLFVAIIPTTSAEKMPLGSINMQPLIEEIAPSSNNLSPKEIAHAVFEKEGGQKQLERTMAEKSHDIFGFFVRQIKEVLSVHSDSAMAQFEAVNSLLEI